MSRQREILDAACRLFEQRGYGGVGVDAIGAEVGISGPSLYGHFAGKAAILAALFDEAMDRMLELAGPVRASASEELDHLVTQHATFAVSHRRLLTIYTREDRALLPEDWERFRARQNAYVDRWVDALAALQPARSREELRSVALAVLGLLMSVTTWPAEALALPDLEGLLRRVALAGLELELEPAR